MVGRRDDGRMEPTGRWYALKYRRDSVTPQIHIRAERDGSVWRFDVEDNGLGIEATAPSAQ